MKRTSVILRRVSQGCGREGFLEENPSELHEMLEGRGEEMGAEGTVFAKALRQQRAQYLKNRKKAALMLCRD